ncbi:MAG: hypothetical protein ULS35scaffold63_10 [Phage 33_17]|nr:MAG: hypothetical protein ULS35scaffold63_10 [Phage 33_17]
MRKLASIQKILEIKEHPNADSLEIATVLGWDIIIKKGAFKQDQLCVFCEIDSFLPIRPEFEFLRKGCYKKLQDQDKEGFRIRTIRLRGQLSQGLLLPINEFEELKNKEWQIDDDITDLLSIIKYEVPIPTILKAQGVCNFPHFIPKTDQVRMQNVWHKYKELYSHILFETTLKLDGTSATYFYNDGEVGLCTRNFKLKPEGDSVYHKIEKQYNIFESLKKYGRNIAIQGEIIGERIQNNPENIKGHEFYVFDVWDIDNQGYILPLVRNGIVCSIFNFQPKEDYLRIPKIGIGRDDNSLTRILEYDSIEDLLKFAEGPSLNSDCREGIVLKSCSYVNGKIISFKVISNEYLLREK